jgi:hypothetical protein
VRRERSNDQENNMNSKASLASAHGRGNRLRRDGGIAAVLVCLAAFAAACGGPGGSAIPGYVNGTPDSPVAFAQCMRAHGVPNFPDPSGGLFNLSGMDQGSPQFQHAAGICGRSGQNPGPARQAQGLAKGLAFARCMRAHGVPNFSDPVANGDGGITSRVRVGGGVDPRSPVFQAAARACLSVLPNGGKPGNSGSAG